MDEAVDLIATLPEGSMYRASLMDYGELSRDERLAYDLIDEIRRFETLYATGSTEGAQLTLRPEGIRAERDRRARAAAARDKIENTEWVSVDG